MIHRNPNDEAQQEALWSFRFMRENNDFPRTRVSIARAAQILRRGSRKENKSRSKPKKQRQASTYPMTPRRSTRILEKARISAGIDSTTNVAPGHLKKKQKITKAEVDVDANAPVVAHDADTTQDPDIISIINQELEAYNNVSKNDYSPGPFTRKQLRKELPLHPLTIAAFCQPIGRLEPPRPEQFLPNPSRQGENNTVTIPNAEMIEGLEYPDPNNPRALIPVPLTGGDFTLDLNEIYESCKQGVMPMEPMRTRSQT